MINESAHSTDGWGECCMFRLRRAAAGFAKGDCLCVVRGQQPEGGELVVDLEGRVGRHGGGPVYGIVVGAVRETRRPRPAPTG